MDACGRAYTNPSWDRSSDTTLTWATAVVNSRTIENSINNGRPTALRSHEIGHTLGLAHPSSSSRVAIMQQNI